MDKKWWAPFLLLLLPMLITALPARADIFQDQISKSFPGFVIMKHAEFDSDVRDNLESNPACLTGYFNQDDIEDFVALIRTIDMKRSVTKQLLSDYHETRLVACHGSAGKKIQLHGTTDWRHDRAGISLSGKTLAGENELPLG